MKPLVSLLLLPVFITACNGPDKTALPDDPAGAQPVEKAAAPAAQPKLVKTQGSDKYQQVRCGIQDKAGNLWFGTSGEGVYRYDGKSFAQFTVKDGLCSNTVWSVLEDNSGNIWFGTADGLCRYDGKTMTTVPISLSTGGLASSGPAAKRAVYCMLQDRNGKLWLGTDEGVYCYNGTGFTKFLDNDGVVNESGLSLKMMQYMLEDKAGNIWFGCGVWEGEGLCRYDGKSVTSFKPNGSGWIRYIVEDKNGILWFGTRRDGNWRYDGKTYAKYTEKASIGAPILADKAGNIWFSGEEHENGYAGKGGVWRYDGQTFKNFTAKDGMGDYSVWCIIEDNAGNTWFGTRNTGLYRYDPHAGTFTGFSE